MNPNDYLAALDGAIAVHERIIGYHQEALAALRNARRLFLENTRTPAPAASPFAPLREDLFEAILTVLRDAEGGLFAAEIAERLGLGNDGRVLRTTLAEMHAAGLVQQELRGVRARWYAHRAQAG